MSEWQPDYPLSGTLGLMEPYELDYLAKEHGVDVASGLKIHAWRYERRYGGDSRPFQLWAYAADGQVTDIIEMPKFGRIEARAELPLFYGLRSGDSYAIKDGNTWITARRPLPTPPEDG